MKHFSIIILFLGLLSFYTKNSSPNIKRKYFKISLSKANAQSGIYTALISGDKSGLSRKFLRQSKQFGLLHLFTPSGLHLSSLFFLRFLPSILLLVVLITIFLLFQDYAYDSLSRVIIFKVIHLTGLSVQNTFLVTILLSLPLGHLFNPLSLMYSALFWGTLIYYRSNPLKVLFYLSLNNIVLNSFLGQTTNLLIFLVNPLLTMIVTSLFPFLLINSLLPVIFQVELSNIFHTFELYFVQACEAINFLNINPSVIETIIILLTIKFPRYGVAIFLLLLPSYTAMETTLPEVKNRNIINLNPQKEIIKNTSRRIEFIDRYCNFKLDCRLKELNKGGIKI